MHSIANCTQNEQANLARVTSHVWAPANNLVRDGSGHCSQNIAMSFSSIPGRRETTSFHEAFVEVADGRVSRMHCCIGRALNPASGKQQAYLEVGCTADVLASAEACRRDTAMVLFA